MRTRSLTDDVKGYFSKKEEVVAAVLFGSHARDRQRPDSDVDVGVLVTEEAAPNAVDLRDQYMVELGRALRKVVHPVIMNTAGEELLRQIFSKGTCVQVNDERAYATFRISAYCRIADFAHYRNMVQRGFVDRLKREVRGG